MDTTQNKTPHISQKKYADMVDVASRTQLRYFLRRAFKELNPSTTLKTNWHIDYICWLLSRTLPDPLNPTPDDKIKRLIINVPPRSLKSEITSVALPAFLLGHMPHLKVIGASYSGKLSMKMNVNTTTVMRSEMFKSLFPNCTLKTERQDLIATTKNGQRFATSVGGTVTGEGGDYLIADDLLNPSEAMSQVERQACNDWFDTTLYSRLNDPDEGVIIIIMQRLHEMDLTGHLLAKNENLPPEMRWHHVNLPAIFESSQTFDYYKTQKVVEDGELLHPDRLSKSKLEEYRGALGSYAFAGQYMQKPAPEGGGLVKLDWFRTYETPPERKNTRRIIQSWDTAIKAGVDNDYSVCTTWAEMDDNSHHLIDVARGKWEYPELKRMAEMLAERHMPNALLIEDKASGQSLIQDLRKETTLPIIGINPKYDKIVRLTTISPMIEAGMVHIPKSAPWRADFDREFMLFPNAAHDDTVDSVSQYLNWLRTQNASFRIRSL